MIERNNVWIRVAGNAEMIRAGEKFHWRCFIDRQEPEIPLVQWRVRGASTTHNLVPGTNPTRDELGLVAWIDCFGDIVVDDHSVATITLAASPDVEE